MVKETYLINEAAKEAGVEPHVLRYWEEELELHIKRNEQGHRIYTQEDIDRFLKIKDLKSKGLQLKAIKNFVEDNPFAQKHMTRIVKPAEEDDRQQAEQAAQATQAMPKKMIEIKSIRSIMKPKSEEPHEQSHEIAHVQQSSAPSAAASDQTERLQYLFQKLIRDAVSANNEELVNRLSERISCSVGDDVRKELDYQFRLIEEREGERTVAEDKRNEEYYRRIDELLSQYRGKAKSPRKQVAAKNATTLSFPISDNEKEPKQKKAFHLFKKTPEAKFE